MAIMEITILSLKEVMGRRRCIGVLVSLVRAIVFSLTLRACLHYGAKLALLQSMQQQRFSWSGEDVLNQLESAFLSISVLHLLPKSKVNQRKSVFC